MKRNGCILKTIIFTLILLFITVRPYSDLKSEVLPAAAGITGNNPNNAGDTNNTSSTDNTRVNLNAVTVPEDISNLPSGKKPVLPAANHDYSFIWGAVHNLSGIYSSAEMYFTLPAYWDTKYAYIQIEYRVSQLIKNVPCSLTFVINKQPFYSCRIEYQNSEPNIIYAAIPLKLLKNNEESRSNLLEVIGYARLYNQKGCVDDNSSANWISISEASGVKVGYNLKLHKNRIDNFPYPFMSSLNKSGSDTAIGVADTLNNEELTTAMLIMTSLSRQTTDDNNITAGHWENIRDKKFKRRILICLTSDIPNELRKYMEPFKSQLKGQVMIRFVNDAKQQPLLIIVSEDADSLAEAGYFLSDSDRVSQIKNSVTFVQKGAAEIRANEIRANGMKTDRFTLEEITGGGFEFIGPFHQVKTLFLPVSPDFTVASDGKVSLNFRYSKNLDFNRSMLTVYWGDIPVGSKKLTAEKADNDELTFFMPADVVGTRAGSMKFAFDLEVPEMFCTQRQDEMPWAYISKTSSIYLPANTATKLNFNNRPAPFQSNGSFNDVLVILPEVPSDSQLTQAGRTLALYGKGSNVYGRLKVCNANEFNDKDANYNIITLGTPLDNSLILKLNNNLYFRFNSSGTEFITNKKLILSADYAKSTGSLQLIRSPYAENRAILVLTGPNENTLKMITRMISNEKMSWNLKDDCVLIDSEGKVRTYQFQTYEVAEKKPTLAESVAENRNSLLFALAGTSVMLVLFFAMILIIIRMRIKKNKE